MKLNAMTKLKEIVGKIKYDKDSSYYDLVSKSYKLKDCYFYTNGLFAVWTKEELENNKIDQDDYDKFKNLRDKLNTCIGELDVKDLKFKDRYVRIDNVGIDSDLLKDALALMSVTNDSKVKLYVDSNSYRKCLRICDREECCLIAPINTMFIENAYSIKNNKLCMAK